MPLGFLLVIVVRPELGRNIATDLLEVRPVRKGAANTRSQSRVTVQRPKAPNSIGSRQRWIYEHEMTDMMDGRHAYAVLLQDTGVDAGILRMLLCCGIRTALFSSGNQAYSIGSQAFQLGKYFEE